MFLDGYYEKITSWMLKRSRLLLDKYFMIPMEEKKR